MNNKKYDEATNYLKSLGNNFNVKNNIFSKINSLDIVLNSKYNLTFENGIRVNILISDDTLDQFDEFHICTIFSNLLQNAIEANLSVEDREKRFISLGGKYMTGFYIISMENSSLPPNKDFITKKNSKNHGIGLSIIKDSVDIYKGSVYFSFDKLSGVFKSIIKIPINE